MLPSFVGEATIRTFTWNNCLYTPGCFVKLVHANKDVPTKRNTLFLITEIMKFHGNLVSFFCEDLQFFRFYATIAS